MKLKKLKTIKIIKKREAIIKEREAIFSHWLKELSSFGWVYTECIKLINQAR